MTRYTLAGSERRAVAVGSRGDEKDGRRVNFRFDAIA